MCWRSHRPNRSSNYGSACSYDAIYDAIKPPVTLEYQRVRPECKLTMKMGICFVGRVKQVRTKFRRLLSYRFRGAIQRLKRPMNE